jgi:hypothetical protein
MHINKSYQGIDCINTAIKKREWVKPTLQILDVSETNGNPGATNTDGGTAPFSAGPKLSH